MFDEPTALHLDAWAGVLLAAAFMLAAAATLLRLNALRRWGQHPFRFSTQLYASNALLGCTLTMALVGISHAAGWPIYGLPVVGGLGLLLSVGVSGFLAVDWWTYIRPELARYDKRYPTAGVPKRGMVRPLRQTQSSAPVMWTLGTAAVAYAVFVWHPWPHIFHEGNWLYGAPAGFAIGSLVAMHRSAESAFMFSPMQPIKRGKVSRRR